MDVASGIENAVCYFSYSRTGNKDHWFTRFTRLKVSNFLIFLGLIFVGSYDEKEKGKDRNKNWKTLLITLSQAVQNNIISVEKNFSSKYRLVENSPEILIHFQEEWKVKFYTGAIIGVTRRVSVPGHTNLFFTSRKHFVEKVLF